MTATDAADAAATDVVIIATIAVLTTAISVSTSTNLIKPAQLNAFTWLKES